MPTTTHPTPAAAPSAYLRTRVLSASPEELRLLLLEGAIKFAKQGAAGLEAKNYEAMFAGFSSARDIIFELLTTIREDPDPELARNAKGVYGFMYRTIVEASHEKDAAKAASVIDLLEYERQTWVMVMDQLAHERGQATRERTPTNISVEG